MPHSPLGSAQFSGKTVLITGGTSGIGRAAVRLFAAEGAQVLFCGRREGPGRALEAKLLAEGGLVRFVPCDVSNEGEVEALVSRATEGGRTLDVAVNAAGISPRRCRLSETSLQTFEAVFATNTRGLFLSLKHEMRTMEHQRSGVIINLASVLGVKAIDLNHAVYTASKHAVVGLTKTAALEGAPWGVRVNAVCPGGIDTPIHETNSSDDAGRRALTALHPLGRLGTAEEVAEVIAFLAGPRSTFMTGSIISVDGGSGL